MKNTTHRSSPVVAITDMHVLTVIASGAILGVFARTTQWDTEGHEKAEQAAAGLISSGSYKRGQLSIQRHELR
jgi:hypothetical protein